MTVSVKLNLNNLHHLAARIKPDVIDQAAFEWAQAVEDRAKELVPVDTGALQESIHVEKGDGDGRYNVVADMPYARFVEFGTGRGPAQPYLIPAWRQVRGLPFFQKHLAELIR
jgi:HK97 gp10 family phage protein